MLGKIQESGQEGGGGLLHPFPENYTHLPKTMHQFGKLKSAYL